jgi:hypothetical protein
MALSETDKSDIRFYLGYSFRGSDPSGLSLYVHSNFLHLEDRLGKLTEPEERRVKNILEELRDMEAELSASRSAIRIDTAGEFKKNKNELSERIAMYNRQRRILAQWLGAKLHSSRIGSFRV